MWMKTVPYGSPEKTASHQRQRDDWWELPTDVGGVRERTDDPGVGALRAALYAQARCDRMVEGGHPLAPLIRSGHG